MPKTWEELSEPEKIEDLRKDIVRIFDALNTLIIDVRNNHVRLNNIEPELNETSAEIARLADRLPKN